VISRRDFVVAGISAGGTALGFHLLGGQPAVVQTLIASDESDSVGGVTIDAGLGKSMNELLQTINGSDALGRTWLDTQSPKPTLASLGMSVGKRFDTQARDLVQAVRQTVMADFEHNRVCELEGWRLSLTECQLAALRVLAIDAHPGNAAILQAREASQGDSDYQIGEVVPVTNWGPRKTLQGKSFNTQADGHSGLWFQARGAPSRVHIMIDGELAKTSVSRHVITSGLFDELQDRILSTPGDYEIALVDPVRHIKQPIGKLVIEKNPSYNLEQRPGADKGFCPVTQWGPKTTRVGVARNEQTDGSMGVWVHIDCYPQDTTLRFGDDALPLTRKEFGFTTSIPLALLESPGEKPLVLMSRSTGAEIAVGHILIE